MCVDEITTWVGVELDALDRRYAPVIDVAAPDPLGPLALRQTIFTFSDPDGVGLRGRAQLWDVRDGERGGEDIEFTVFVEALVDRPSRRARPKAVHLYGVDLRRTGQTFEVSMDTPWAIARYDTGEPVLAYGVERLIRGGFTYRTPGRPWRTTTAPPYARSGQ